MAVVHRVPKTVAQMNGDVRAWAAENGDFVKDVIDKHRAWVEEAAIQKLQKAYDNHLESVELRDRAKGDDVNNKLHASFAQLVIDTPVDYLLGKPIVWTVEDPEGEAPVELTEAYRDELLRLFRKGAAQRVLSEQMRQGSIAYYSGVILWVDEDGQIDYEEFPVQELIPVYDTRGRLRLVIRSYVVEYTENGTPVSRTKVEVYDKKYVSYLVSSRDGNAYEYDEEEAPGNPVAHQAGRIPVSIYVNGTPAEYDKRKLRVGVSDLNAGILSLIENYAHTMSDKANFSTYALDQLLKLIGVDIQEKEVLKMREARALALKNKDSDAAFIAPQMDDEGVENHLKRMKDDIQDMAQLPKLSELKNASATEIKTKYTALDTRANKKELYFSAAITQFVAVLTDMLNAKRLTDAGVENVWGVLSGEDEPPTSTPLYNPDWVQATLVRNQPQNTLEIAQTVQMLAGIVPDSYLYEQLWFIPDPVAALEEMKKQKEEAAKLAMASMYPDDEFRNTDDGAGNEGGGQ